VEYVTAQSLLHCGRSEKVQEEDPGDLVKRLDTLHKYNLRGQNIRVETQIFRGQQ